MMDQHQQAVFVAAVGLGGRALAQSAQFKTS